MNPQQTQPNNPQPSQQPSFQPLPKTNPGQAFQNNAQTPQAPTSQQMNDARGNLGFVNALHTQLLQYKYGQQSTQGQQTQASKQGTEGGGKEETESPKLDDLETKIDKKLEVLK